MAEKGSRWPPRVVQRSEWDNGGGVAVLCGDFQHRVDRDGNGVVARDHPSAESEIAEAREALSRGDLAPLGYRFVDNGFLIGDLERWRRGRRTWAEPWPRCGSERFGQIDDPAELAPCIRLAVERLVPCKWCGNLLARGDSCSPSDITTCALSSGNGWRHAIPPGWVQGTQIGSPHGLSTVGWPDRYRWIHRSPLTHLRQVFLASPWWPELHPRRLKNLVCQHAADYRVPTTRAFEAVATELTQTLGPMKAPPPITDFQLA